MVSYCSNGVLVLVRVLGQVLKLARVVAERLNFD